MGRTYKLHCVLQSGCSPCHNLKTGHLPNMKICLAQMGVLVNVIDLKVPSTLSTLTTQDRESWLGKVNSTPHLILCGYDERNSILFAESINPSPLTAENICAEVRAILKK